MLEFLKTSEADAIRVAAEDLRDTVSGIFQEMDVPYEDATLAADVLVSADLRGVETHGVSNMLPSYVKGYTNGEINPRPMWRVVRQSLAVANIDSDRGLGIIVVPKAMSLAIEKAKSTGVGMVTVGNGRHLGMASYHAMLALKHDMIGVCMTSAPPRMVPTFGAEPRLGTNPIAVAAPAYEEPPFVFDGATTVVAQNKLALAERLGASIPAGWVADDSGTPVMEVSKGLGGAPMLPLGSVRELGSHKGYGLACMVDIMCGILSGKAFGMVPGRPNFSHFVGAYNIEAFTDLLEFKETMDLFLRTLKQTPPAPGHERVLVPGQPEWETENERRAHGIPLHKNVFRWLQDTCNELGVTCAL
jgi:LDH2 family malate/lactate/ureidoglycolate dehydrogenase